MKDVIVITGVSTQEHPWFLSYRDQLFNAGIDMHVENISNVAWLGRGGFISEKVNLFRYFAKLFSQYKFLVMSDGFDVKFFGTKDQLMTRLVRHEGIVLHAAEKNCYPDPTLAPKIAEVGPWRFANGGLSMGMPMAYLKWCDEVTNHPRYTPEILDQHFMNILLAERSGIQFIDYLTETFFCLYGGYPELEFHNGKPHNTHHRTDPLFVHANGKWDSIEMIMKYTRSLENNNG